MITGIDHIGLSSGDIERDSEVLARAGYSLLFHEKNAPNPPEKAPVLFRRNPRHDLALLTRSEGLGIELLNHGSIADGVDSQMALVVTGTDGLDSRVRGEVRICGKEYAEVDIADIPCAVIVTDHGPNFVCTGVCVSVGDISKSIEFWAWFGCKVIEADKVSAHLAFKELLTRKTWSIFLVLDERRVSKQYMDSFGVNSVAFMSTSVSKDKDALSSRGYGTTSIYNIGINGKPLSIMFVRGPSGENVELISPAGKDALIIREI